jgi:hypothetical protein
VQNVIKAACFCIRADLTVKPAAEVEEAVWLASDGANLPLAPLVHDHLLPIAQQRLAVR